MEGDDFTPDPHAQSGFPRASGSDETCIFAEFRQHARRHARRFQMCKIHRPPSVGSPFILSILDLNGVLNTSLVQSSSPSSAIVLLLVTDFRLSFHGMAVGRISEL